MRIQIITNDKCDKMKVQGITVSPLNKPISLDEFDINIVDLSTPSLWRHNQGVPNSINVINDFKSIKQMAERKSSSALLYVFPANVEFLYSYSVHHQKDYGFQQKRQVKDCMQSVAEIISKAMPFAVQPPSLIYENTTTTINDMDYSASFFFEDAYNSITKSNKSCKATTINYSSKAFLTTLQILESPEKLNNYINFLFPPTPLEEMPQWAKELKILNDEELTIRIDDANERIHQLEASISEANEALQRNARIKSILYTNGSELVEVVFSLLEEILSCDLSEFEDEKKEDFQIKKDAYTLIGEIKGVTSNIKNEHISQVDVHYQGYLDKLAEEELQESVHQVLIMNPFRTKPISEREPVHDTQIKLAERNGCLVIETATLLKLYEKFVAGEIDVPSCEKLFTEKTGLLKETDF